MACGCSSSPSTYTSSNVVSNGCGVPSCNCNLPRRSSIPPVVPVLWKDAARFRQMSAGVLVVHCGEEMGSLDSPIDGFVKFDAATGKVYVTGSSTEYVVDYFACTNDQIFGFPLYGVKPECRDMGENPDRRVAIVRPPNSAYGIVYGHEQTCSPLTGLKPEITPVQIVPDAFPEVAHTGVWTFAWIDIPPGEDCSGPRRHYFAVPCEDVSSIDADRMRPNYDIPAQPLDASQDATFGLAIWVYDNPSTKWELHKVSNQSLQEMIGYAQPIVLFDSPYRIYYQGRTNGMHGDLPIGPTIPVTGLFPAVSESVTIDLTTVPGWDPAFTGVIIASQMYISSFTQGFDCNLQVNGISHVFAGIASDSPTDNEVASSVNEKMVKFSPTSKSIQVSFTNQIVSAGNPVFMFVAAYIVGFVR